MARKTKSQRNEATAGAQPAPRKPSSGLIGHTPEGFPVYAPPVEPTQSTPAEIQQWIRQWMDEGERAAAKAR